MPTLSIGTFLLLLLFCQQYYPQAVPIGDAVIGNQASIANTTISEEYPPRGVPFYPSSPNPLRLLYTTRKPPATCKNVPEYLIGDCVDMGIWKLDRLIAMRGGDAQIRILTTEGEFKCQSLFQSLCIQFFPQLREPTYEEVKWGLQAIKQASVDDTFNYHQEATIFASDTRKTTRPSGDYVPVSRIEMTLSIGQTESSAVT